MIIQIFIIILHRVCGLVRRKGEIRHLKTGSRRWFHWASAPQGQCNASSGQKRSWEAEGFGEFGMLTFATYLPSDTCSTNIVILGERKDWKRSRTSGADEPESSTSLDSSAAVTWNLASTKLLGCVFFDELRTGRIDPCDASCWVCLCVSMAQIDWPQEGWLEFTKWPNASKRTYRIRWDQWPKKRVTMPLGRDQSNCTLVKLHRVKRWEVWELHISSTKKASWDLQVGFFYVFQRFYPLMAIRNLLSSYFQILFEKLHGSKSSSLRKGALI